MAIARDSSSPARFNLTTGVAFVGPDSGTSASFNPPADSWLYASIPTNEGAGNTSSVSVTNTGTALTWNQVANVTNASGGGAEVWRAYNSAAQTGITVSVTVTYTPSGGGAAAASNSVAAWVDVWTGANTSQAGAATATSTGTAQTNNPSVTTTATGSRVCLLGLDWVAQGNPTSSDTIDSYTHAGSTSGGRAYLASNSGAPGGVSVNFVDGGASPINSFIIYEILAPSAPTINSDPSNATVYESQTANFTVSATTSGGTLHYQWKDDGSNVGSDSSSYSPTVSLSDSGSVITCDVSDDNGTITSNGAVLTVLPTARIAWLVH